MPDVLVGAVERAEANGDAEDALAAPVLAGHERELLERGRLAAVDEQLDGLLDVGAQYELERVVVLVEARAVYGHDEVEKGLEAGSRARRVVLHLFVVVVVVECQCDLYLNGWKRGDYLENVVALGAATRYTYC